MVYQSWLAAPIIGRQVPWLTSYVSELAAAGQPYAGFYRTADLVTGLLLLVAIAVSWPALFAAPNAVNRTRTRIGLVLIGVAALATCVDSRFPMSCATSLQRHCDKVTEGASWTDSLHQVASVVVAGSTMAAMVLLSWSVLQSRWVRVVAVMTLGLTVLTGIEGLLRDSLVHYPTLLGLVQVCSIVGLALWWSGASWHLLRAASAGAAQPDPGRAGVDQPVGEQ